MPNPYLSRHCPNPFYFELNNIKPAGLDNKLPTLTYFFKKKSTIIKFKAL
ncbi:hypothetical protein Syun_013009 [Stephania yunnanensis]|uniref:Uncharacterized protein n=1 Tax=Stephania yunnanensis TaxID=152371 RepID=A0AAP0K1B0_9MAGN